MHLSRRSILLVGGSSLLALVAACGAPNSGGSDTVNSLVVALYYTMSAAGIRAQQSVDAMAVIYTSMMLVLLITALRYVNPTQLVARVREEPDS
jgi:hypothetical protein